MPLQFHFRSVSVKCKGCVAKIPADQLHLSTTRNENYHLECLPDGVVRQAYCKVRRDSLDDLPSGVRETVLDILQRGKGLQIQMQHEIREAREAKKAREIVQLHRDCIKQPRAIIGHRSISGRVIETSYSFCKLVDATKFGRKLTLQEFAKERVKCLFSGPFDFGAVYPGLRGNFYRPANLELHLVRVRAGWKEKVGEPFKKSCNIFQRMREHCQPMGAECWPRQYCCALREEQLESRAELVDKSIF